MIDISIITIQLIFNFFTINCVAAIDSEISDSSTLTWRLDIPPEDSEFSPFFSENIFETGISVSSLKVPFRFTLMTEL